jgi:hypothetical protein
MKLALVIRDYIDLKQAMGSRFHTEAVILKAFCQAVGDIFIAEVRVEHVAAYLARRGPVTRFWHRKASALQGLYRFAIGRGYVGCSPGEWPPSCQAASSRADSEAVSDTGGAGAVVTNGPRLSHCWASQPLQS